MDVVAVFLTLTAFFAYLNARFLKLPPTIGVMAFSLGLSVLLVGLNAFGMLPGVLAREELLLYSLDLSHLLLDGMLSVLLFAGALEVDLGRLRAFRWQVGGLALVGTVVSTGIIGVVLWYVLPLVGQPLSLAYCLLFGALISPIDPIAIMGIIKSAGVPEDLEFVITGESLFNDGVGLALFLLMLNVISGEAQPGAGEAALLLLREAGGGLAFGVVLGYVGLLLMRGIDEFETEVLITLAIVVGGYALAEQLQISGPMAMVVAGIIIGNQGRAQAMSRRTRRHVDSFWQLLNGIFNAVLFVLMGMVVLVIPFQAWLLPAAGVTIVVILLARVLSAGLPVALLSKTFGLPPGSWRVLSWSGLRGGIPVALALSLPEGEERLVLIPLTYCVVVFSIFCQGLTIGAVVRSSLKPAS